MNRFIFVFILLFAQAALAMILSKSSYCENSLTTLSQEYSLPITLAESHNLIFIPQDNLPLSELEWQEIEDHHRRANFFRVQDDANRSLEIEALRLSEKYNGIKKVFSSPLSKLIPLVQQFTGYGYYWSSLNFIRLLREDYLNTHADVINPFGGTTESTVTAILFLNDNYSGGEVNIHSGSFLQIEDYQPSMLRFSFKPPARSMLIMLNLPLYSTNKVLAGHSESVYLFFHPYSER